LVKFTLTSLAAAATTTISITCSSRKWKIQVIEKKEGKIRSQRSGPSETDPQDSQGKTKEQILIKFALALSFKQIYNVGVASAKRRRRGR